MAYFSTDIYRGKRRISANQRSQRKRSCRSSFRCVSSCQSCNKEAIWQSVREAKQAGVRCIIALPHWGDEYTVKVNNAQRECARWLVRNGVDVVVGSHPHRLQSVEYYRGQLIVYSLGNLIFTSQDPPGFNRRSVLELSLNSMGELQDYSLFDLGK